MTLEELQAEYDSLENEHTAKVDSTKALKAEIERLADLLSRAKVKNLELQASSCVGKFYKTKDHYADYLFYATGTDSKYLAEDSRSRTPVVVGTEFTVSKDGLSKIAMDNDSYVSLSHLGEKYEVATRDYALGILSRFSALVSDLTLIA